MARSFKQELRTTLILFLGSLAAASVLLYLLSKDVDLRAREANEKRALIQEQSVLTERIAQLKRDRQLALQYSQAIDRLVPTKDQLFDFSDWLDSSARNYGVKLDFRFTGEEIKPAGDILGHAGFSSGLNGSLASLASFLKNLELQSTQFLISLDSYEVKKVGDDYQVSVLGKVYYKE